MFRSAAALGVDAVLITPRCADPLYRRAVRVSMGTVFQVPWTRIEPWPAGLQVLRDHGFTVAAFALGDGAISLDDLAANQPDRLAMVFGTEGDGLSRLAVKGADLVVKIPMAGGVDSLNMAAASAVALWALRAPLRHSRTPNRPNSLSEAYSGGYAVFGREAVSASVSASVGQTVTTRSRPVRFASYNAASAAAIAPRDGTVRPTPTETVTARPGATCSQGALRTASCNRSATSSAALPPPNTRMRNSSPP